MPSSAPSTGRLLLCLMTAASIWSGSALALERIDLAAAGACDGNSAVDYRMLFAMDGGASAEAFAKVPALTGKSDGFPAVAAGKGKEVASRILPAAARGGSGESGEEWLRSDDSAPVKPGIWALLLAGFLGVCAVARPRIFES